MKTILTMALALMVGVMTLCSQPTTNTDFRFVTNQLYNVQKSVLWQTIPPTNNYRGYNQRERMDIFSAEVIQSNSNHIAIRITAHKYQGSTHINDRRERIEEWDFKIIYIVNHPKRFNVGDTFKSERLFPIEGNLTNKSGNVSFVKAYTYGTLPQQIKK